MATEKKIIQFNVTVEEANLLFKALGNLPFKDVYELIGKLNEQANHQLKNRNSKDSFIETSNISIDDLIQ